jgi:hypothetical protein
MIILGIHNIFKILCSHSTDGVNVGLLRKCCVDLYVHTNISEYHTVFIPEDGENMCFKNFGVYLKSTRRYYTEEQH